MRAHPGSALLQNANFAAPPRFFTIPGFPSAQSLATLPAMSHPQWLDELAPSGADMASMYQQTKLADTATRLAWMEKAPADF